MPNLEYSTSPQQSQDKLHKQLAIRASIGQSIASNMVKADQKNLVTLTRTMPHQQERFGEYYYALGLHMQTTFFVSELDEVTLDKVHEEKRVIIDDYDLVDAIIEEVPDGFLTDRQHMAEEATRGCQEVREALLYQFELKDGDLRNAKRTGTNTDLRGAVPFSENTIKIVPTNMDNVTCEIVQPAGEIFPIRTLVFAPFER